MTPLRRCRRCRRAALQISQVSAPRPALARSVRCRDRRLADVCRGAGLAPLSLVQAVAASGAAVLAFVTARGHPSRLARREQAAVVLAVAGLILLALSLVGKAESDHSGGRRRHHLARGVRRRRGAAYRCADPFWPCGLARSAAGPLFADGDVSAKLVGYGGLGDRAGPADRRLRYRDERPAVGLPAGRRAHGGRHGDQVTNAVPIAAGFVLFGETLPHGTRAVLQVAAFACLVASAVALGHQQTPRVGRGLRALQPGADQRRKGRPESCLRVRTSAQS